MIIKEWNLGHVKCNLVWTGTHYAAQAVLYGQIIYESEWGPYTEKDRSEATENMIKNAFVWQEVKAVFEEWLGGYIL